MKNITILGSTGSIGTQTLAVVAANQDKFKVVALTANSNDQLLEQQINEFAPAIAVLVDEMAAQRLKRRYKGNTKILAGREGLLEAAVYQSAAIVVTSLVGFAGLEPTIAAIKAGKDIALANKETLVVAGEIVMQLAKEYKVAILPVDSEHSAIFQCLQGEQYHAISKIWLTASGGPFRGMKTSDLRAVSRERCLQHPNWSMGQKITIDSASLANKGLEVIEAKWLYGVDYEQIHVIIHPQSIIHSMVEFVDGATIAQLGLPDMKVPIQYALTYPTRTPAEFPRADFGKMKNLTFEEPDRETFKALDMAFAAGKCGGSMPCVFNAANEIAVYAFLRNSISFLDIYDIIAATLKAHQNIVAPTLTDLYAVDAWARKYATDLL